MMERRVALFDWDGTLRADFTIRAWIEFLINRGLVDEEIQHSLDKLFNSYTDGRLNHDKLSKSCASLYGNGLKGLKASRVSHVADEFRIEDRGSLFSFGRTVSKILTDYGFEIVVISGAPDEVIRGYSAELSVKKMFALEIESKKGIYTGNIYSNPGINGTKAALARHVLDSEDYNIVAGVGNSDSDLPVFYCAQIRIVVNNPLLLSNTDCYHIRSDNFDERRFYQFIEREVERYG